MSRQREQLPLFGDLLSRLVFAFEIVADRHFMGFFDHSRWPDPKETTEACLRDLTEQDRSSEDASQQQATANPQNEARH